MSIFSRLIEASQDKDMIPRIALGYLGVMTVAEVLTALYDPSLGLIVHGVLLVALMLHSSRTLEYPIHGLLLILAFAPLIRLLSLSLPLASVPRVYWYLITSVPLFITAFVVVRTLGLSGASISMKWGRVPLQLLFGLSGLALGYIEYQILRPQPLAKALTWKEAAIPALILLVCTGFLEELIFRGIMQRVAVRSLGRFGLIYVALIFAILHIGHRSLLDILFVLGVGLLFGWVVVKTRSLLGVTLAHGFTNIMLFVVLPLLPALSPSIAPSALGTPLPPRMATGAAVTVSATSGVSTAATGASETQALESTTTPAEEATQTDIPSLASPTVEPTPVPDLEETATAIPAPITATVIQTPEALATASPMPTSTATVTAAEPAGAVRNHSFEIGDEDEEESAQGWMTYGWIPGVRTVEEAYDGDRSVHVGVPRDGPNHYSFSSVGQLLELPPGEVISATLRFQYFAESDRPIYDDDSQYVLILDRTERTQAEVMRLSYEEANGRIWVESPEIDLTGYSWPLVVHFEVYNDGLWGTSRMYIDDVRVRIRMSETVTPGPATALPDAGAGAG